MANTEGKMGLGMMLSTSQYFFLTCQTQVLVEKIKVENSNK
jgi:hypothetical protein